MSLKKLKNITEEILNEATLDQVVSSLNKDAMIKQAIYDNEFSQGDEFDNRMLQELGDDSAKKITEELGEEVPEDISYSDYVRDSLDFIDYSETKAYKQFIYNRMSYGLEQAISNLQYIVRRQKDSRGLLNLFRVIGIEHRNMKKNDIPVYNSGITWLQHLQEQGKHLGIYWAESYNKAKEFGMYNVSGDRHIIKIAIEDKYIDWIDTIRLRMDLSLADEEEIRLFKNTPIKIEALYDEAHYGKEIDITDIKDKVFYA